MKLDPNVVFAGEVPQNYDRYLGPAFFEPFAQDMVGRLKAEGLKTVLELACGTGIVTRRLRDALPAQVKLVATDLTTDMFQFAQPKFKAGENIEWKQADASALPFGDNEFDAVLCQFGVMFVPDKAAVMRESYRVLRPGGQFIFNVWDSFKSNPIGEIAHTTIASFFDSDPPKFYLIPFGFSDEKAIRELLEEAGFADIEMSRINLPCRNTSAKAFATGLIRGNPVGAECTQRGVDPEKVIDAVAKKIADRFGSEPVEATMQALVWQATRR